MEKSKPELRKGFLSEFVDKATNVESGLWKILVCTAIIIGLVVTYIQYRATDMSTTNISGMFISTCILVVPIVIYNIIQ